MLHTGRSGEERGPFKALSTLAAIVADFGDYSRRIRRQICPEFGDSRQCGQGLKDTYTYMSML